MRTTWGNEEKLVKKKKKKKQKIKLVYRDHKEEQDQKNAEHGK